MNAVRAAALGLGAAAILASGVGAGAATLELPDDAGALPGESAMVSIRVDDASGMLGTDLVITYDPAVAAATAVSLTGLSAAQTLVTNLSVPGVIRIALYGPTPLGGTGNLLEISFTSEGPLGSESLLHFASAGLNEGALPAILVDGRYTVQGRAEEVRNLVLAHADPSSVAMLAWSADPFATTYNVYRGARRDLGDLACFRTEIADPAAQDDGAGPAPRGVLHYLVTAVNVRAESSLGWNSAGSERLAAIPCP